MEPQDNPEKKKRLKKVKKVNNTELGSQIASVIKEAVETKFKESLQRRKTQDELDAMVVTCEEFMKSFIILGYDFEGKAVDPIVVAHNQQEADSLGNYLNKFIANSARWPQQN